jgi:hypothetical protein
VRCKGRTCLIRSNEFERPLLRLRKARANATLMCSDYRPKTMMATARSLQTGASSTLT